MKKFKLLKVSTVAISLDILLKGQLSFLNKYYNVVAVSGFDKHLENVKNREKVPTISVSFQRNISPLQDIISLIKIYSVLKKEKPYMVHSITPKAGLLTMTAAYFARVPIRIHTFTGLVFPYKKGIFQKILIFMDKVLCHFATHIIPEGQGVKNDLINYKITKKPLKIIANGNINGVDLEYFNPNLFPVDSCNKLRKKLGIDANDFVFLFIGRLVKDKGINELVAAFSKFENQNNTVKLLLVGPAEAHLDPLENATLQEINNSKNIISVGFQDDVRPFYALSNCLVFPSYREGFPNVVLQAGAMNLPSIVTNISGCNEIIEQHKNGIIIPVKNENAIFEAMQLLYLDKKLAENCKKNAQNVIATKFNQDLVWQELLNFYKQLEKNELETKP